MAADPPAKKERPKRIDLYDSDPFSNQTLLTRWKMRSFTLEELDAYIAENRKRMAEAQKEGVSISMLDSYARLEPILDKYRDGDLIWQYDNMLWEKRLGRHGYALFRKGKLITHVTLLMN